MRKTPAGHGPGTCDVRDIVALGRNSRICWVCIHTHRRPKGARNSQATTASPLPVFLVEVRPKHRKNRTRSAFVDIFASTKQKSPFIEQRNNGRGSDWKFPGRAEVPRRVEGTLRSYVLGKNFNKAFDTFLIPRLNCLIQVLFRRLSQRIYTSSRAEWRLSLQNGNLHGL
jgi:hypothetical protein